MKATPHDFILLFADAIDREAALMKVEDRFRDYNEWDSIALLSLLVMLDDNYSVNIAKEIFERLETIQDIIDQINRM
jgi:acyl carrier protein